MGTAANEIVISVYGPEGELQGRAVGTGASLRVEPGASEAAEVLFAHLAATPVRRRRPC